MTWIMLTEEAAEFFFESDGPVSDSTIDDELAKWLICPECDTRKVAFIFWNEGCDMDFHCVDCDENYGVR